MADDTVFTGPAPYVLPEDWPALADRGVATWAAGHADHVAQLDHMAARPSTSPALVGLVAPDHLDAYAATRERAPSSVLVDYLDEEAMLGVLRPGGCSTLATQFRLRLRLSRRWPVPDRWVAAERQAEKLTGVLARLAGVDGVCVHVSFHDRTPDLNLTVDLCRRRSPTMVAQLETLHWALTYASAVGGRLRATSSAGRAEEFEMRAAMAL